MRRLFINEPISDDITITGNDATHLLYAMRVRPNQVFVIVDKNGTVAQAKVVSCTSDTVNMKLVSFIDDANTESPIEVVLAQCLPKSDKMDYIVQKAVELGVNSIVPVISSHCIVKYDNKKRQNRLLKWQKVADEAAKQCGRTSLPVIKDFMNLPQLIENSDYKDYCRLICYEAEEKQGIAQVLQSVDEKQDKFLVLIGPEGGFSPQEAELCKQAGFFSISMGSRILRTETASLAALTIVMYEKGDLK